MKFRQQLLIAVGLLAVVACNDDDDGPDEMMPCVVDGGTITGGPFAFTIDGLADQISGVEVTGSVGPKDTYVVTDGDGVILALFDPLADLEGNDFDGAGVGTCLIYNVSYQEGIRGLTIGSEISGLEGCFDLSEPIEVVRDPCPAVAPTLSGGPFAFSVDGQPDFLSATEVEVTGGDSDSSFFVLTTTGGTVVRYFEDEDDFDAVDFDTLALDTFQLWVLAYNDALSGDTLGGLASDIRGCLALSEPSLVLRECRAEGGTLEGGPFLFEVDSDPDFIQPGAVSLSGAEGEVTTYVVTDADGVILGLPPDLDALGDVDFNAAGDGICLVWHLSANGELAGDTLGGLATAIDGCYSLSNPLEVRRNCLADGGLLQGGPFSVTVDTVGTPDTIDVSQLTLAGEEGESGTYVVTNADNVILALPGDLDALGDFDFANSDTLTTSNFIWHLSYNGAIGGASVGADATSITGCADLSNPVEVQRKFD